MKIPGLKLLQITLLTAVVLNVSADLKSDMNNAELSLAAIMQEAIVDGLTVAGAVQQMIEADPTLASGIVATAMIVAPEQYRENISAAIGAGVPAVNVVTSALFAVTGENADQIIQAAIEFAPKAENEIMAVSARILPQVGISKKLVVAPAGVPAGVPVEQEISSVSIAGPSPTPEDVMRAGDSAYKRLITRAEIIAAAEAAAAEWMSLEEAAVAAASEAEIAALAAEEASIKANAASVRVVTAATTTRTREAEEAAGSALAETARLTEAVASAQKAAKEAALVVVVIQATEAKAIANSAKSAADITEAAIELAEAALDAVIVSAHGGLTTLKAALAKVEVAKVEVDAAIDCCEGGTDKI